MTDEERDAAVDELVEEWHEGHHGPDVGLHEHLGLDVDQYGRFLRYGELPAGYVPPNRGGGKAPVESAGNPIVHVLLALLVAGFMLWAAFEIGRPK